MKTKLLFALFFFVILIQAQKTFVIGSVVNDIGDKMSATIVVNTRTDERTLTDILGNFIIEAKSYDELRFVREGYDLKYVKLSIKEFNQPMLVNLQKPPVDIEEVKIAFNPTGNLKKDIAYFRTNSKTSQLNAEIRQYLRYKQTEVYPINSIPTAFKPYDFSTGQISLLNVGGGGNGGVLGLLGNAIFGKKTSSKSLNSVEIEDFYKRVKTVVDVDYFLGYGLDEYDFELFLAYADRKFSLSKKYARNFNKAAIESDLKMALVEFLKVYKTAS